MSRSRACTCARVFVCMFVCACACSSLLLYSKNRRGCTRHLDIKNHFPQVQFEMSDTTSLTVSAKQTMSQRV